MSLEYRILKNPRFREEVVSGTPREYQVVEKLRKLFSEYSDWVKVVDVPSTTWVEQDCFIEINNEVIKCHVMPYVSKCEVEGRLVNGVIVDDKIVFDKKDFVEDSIVFINFPEELDVVKYVVLKLSSLGVKAVVFYDKKYNVYRRSVVVGDETYSFNHGSPPPIPVVSTLYSDIAKYVRKRENSRVKIRIDAYVKHDVFSKTVIAGINGMGEKELHITAHHDHWFTGFSDNLVGVETLYQILKWAKNAVGDRLVNLVLISFSSEEMGAPYYMSWYWAWGSRYYTSVLEEENLVENIIANINVDAIYRYPLEIYGNPSLKPCIDKVIQGFNAQYMGYDHMDFDSFSYTLHGVPALTITTISNIDPVYHSSIDDGTTNDQHIVEDTVKLVQSIIKCLTREKPSYKHLVNYVKENLSEKASLEARILLSKLENLHKLLPNETKRIVFVTRHFTKTTYIPGIRLEYLTGIFSDIILLMNISSNLEKYVGRNIRVYSYDDIVFSTIVSEYNLNLLKDLIKTVINNRVLAYNKHSEKTILLEIMREKLRNEARTALGE